MFLCSANQVLNEHFVWKKCSLPYLLAGGRSHWGLCVNHPEEMGMHLNIHQHQRLHRQRLSVVATGFLIRTLMRLCVHMSHVHLCLQNFITGSMQPCPTNLVNISLRNKKSQLLTILWTISCAKVSLLFNHQWRQIQESGWRRDRI